MKDLINNVYSILEGENIGCINIASKKLFDEISKEIVGYGCFGSVIYSALLDKLFSTIKLAKEHNWLNEEFDFFDISVENGDHDYTYAYQLALYLFPPVICHVRRRPDSTLVGLKEIYAFRKLNELDIENICDLFTDSVRDNIKTNLANLKSTEEATEVIINGTFLLPF